MLAGSPGGPPFGAVVLVREGIASWIERRAKSVKLADPSEAQSVSKPLMSNGLHKEIVPVLADIALTYREEMNP